MIIFLAGAEFMSRFGYFLFTNMNCQLFTYTLYGNRILQVKCAPSSVICQVSKQKQEEVFQFFFNEDAGRGYLQEQIVFADKH